MKKFLKIFGIITLVFILLLAFLIAAPFLFKDKIIEFAKKELNSMLTAEVDFNALKLSFIRSFPDAHVSMEDLTVIGTGDFQGDTLIALKRFNLTVDIKSVFKMENIEVKSLMFDKARIYARVLEDGRVNWDIVKPFDEETPDAELADTTLFNMALRKVEFLNADIVYRDDEMQMLAVITDMNYRLRGDMTLDNAMLKMEGSIAELDFWMDGIRYLKKARAGFISDVDADLDNWVFKFKDSRFNINEIVTNFSGTVIMPEDDIDVDITFAAEKTDFKNLLSLIPAIYMQDFESVQTRGNLTLNGHLKGTLNDYQTPSANLNMIVDNAMFKYPDLPKSMEKINIAAKIYYDGVVFDRTTVDVSKFNFEMAGNPFAAEFQVKTPESDMQIVAKFKGKIDLNSLADVIPLDDMTLKGMLECDLALAGRLSTLENEQFEDFQAEGMLILSDFDYESTDFPQGVKITSTQLNFTPKKVDLVNFDAIIGRTDIAMNGTLENFIPFVFKDETVRGTLNLKSNTVDLNEFMDEDEAETEEDTLSVIEVPKNIDFVVNANIGTVLFDKLIINNAVGEMFVKDGKIEMKNVAMKMLGGNMLLNGEYNTQDMKTPFVDFAIDVTLFDITSSLSSFSMLQSMFPEPENYVGKVSTKLNFHTVLDQNFDPVLSSVFSKGTLHTYNLELRNSKLFGTLADFLKDDKWRTPSPNNLFIRYEIADGRLSVEPIKMNIAHSKIEIEGDQGLDMSLNYKVNAAMPISAIGPGANDLLSKIPGVSTLKEIKLTGFLGGTVTKPEIRFSIADMAGAVTDALREQADALKDKATEIVTEKIDEAKAQVSEEINKRVDEIMAGARKQADNIRSTSKQAADKVRNEFNANANKLESEAKNPAAKVAAKVAADKLRSEGETKARQIEREGEAQAQAVINTAQKQANEIKSSL